MEDFGGVGFDAGRRGGGSKLLGWERRGGGAETEHRARGRAAKERNPEVAVVGPPWRMV